MAIRAKRYILASYFHGWPRREDFIIEEKELLPLEDGQFLAKAIYISVDPSVRAFVNKMKVGDPIMIAEQVAKIIESKSSKFPVGTYITACFGWCTYTIADENFTDLVGQTKPRIIPDGPVLYGEHALALPLGVLGTPGFAAYFGFLEICQPQRGETVVVTAAGGAVGSIVGQIAKIMGCKVIGIAGSNKKEQYLKECGFDVFINYKKPDFAQVLQDHTPSGVDCYFDNVGGKISSIIINRMNTCGRISVCGSISSYNDTPESNPSALILQPAVVFKELKMQGFMVFRWSDRYTEAQMQNLQWLNQGILKYKQTVTEGFENLFDAFISMLQGGNIGKALLKV